MLDTAEYIATGLTYYVGAAAIDATATFASNGATWLAHATHKKENDAEKKHRLQRYNKMIDCRIKHIQNNLKQDEKDTIKALYHDLNVSNEQQQKIESYINQLKQFEKEYMLQPHEETKCDQATEDTLKQFFEDPLVSSLFKICDLHPDGIKKVVSSIPHPTDATASALALRAQITIIDDIITINKIDNPPTLTIYPPSFKFKQFMLASFAHELAHITAHHSLIQTRIPWGIASLTGTEYEKIFSNKNFLKLSIIHEQQAEILYKNAELAAKMREVRSIGYLSDQLFLSHYAQLTEIDELHKLKSKIADFKPIPIRKFADLKNMKFNGPILRR